MPSAELPGEPPGIPELQPVIRHRDEGALQRLYAKGRPDSDGQAPVHHELRAKPAVANRAVLRLADPIERAEQFPALQSGLQCAIDLHGIPTMVVTTRFGFTQHDFANFPNGGGFDPTALGFPSSLISQAPGKYLPRHQLHQLYRLWRGGHEPRHQHELVRDQFRQQVAG